MLAYDLEDEAEQDPDYGSDYNSKDNEKDVIYKLHFKLLTASKINIFIFLNQVLFSQSYI